ncbi:hypothetical protein BN2364_4173 [Alloalcanivorax xenomutans]|nr:hypothetical protein BN2364_4173 [Alloalcanivorax xenomutans]
MAGILYGGHRKLPGAIKKLAALCSARGNAASVGAGVAKRHKTVILEP